MRAVFADSPEAQKWLDTIRSVSEDARDQIQIPDEQTWREWLLFCEVPEEDIDAVVATSPSPTRNPELYEVLQRGAAYLVSYMGNIERPVPFAALADVNDPETRYFYVQLLAACLPFVREFHASRGIPEDVTQQTVADLGRNIRVHRKREGVGGLGVMWWLMLHFRGVIYQLGRLQFEMQVAGDDIAKSIRAHGNQADADSHVLSIHIPDFMGPMDVASCDASIARAVPFFNEFFADWPVEYGVCNSWLLDPQLKSFLKPQSNIIQFQNRYALTEDSYDSSDSVMQFVFGKHVRDIDTVHPVSSLERGVVDHLKQGNSWHGRTGWFRLPD